MDRSQIYLFFLCWLNHFSKYQWFSQGGCFKWQCPKCQLICSLRNCSKWRIYTGFYCIGITRCPWFSEKGCVSWLIFIYCMLTIISQISLWGTLNSTVGRSFVSWFLLVLSQITAWFDCCWIFQEEDVRLVANLMPKQSRFLPIPPRRDNEYYLPYACFRLACERLFGLAKCYSVYSRDIPAAEFASQDIHLIVAKVNFSLNSGASIAKVASLAEQHNDSAA